MNAKEYHSEYHALLGDDLWRVWSQVNFGKAATPINTIGEGLVKRAFGYQVGSGMHFLLTELGLTNKDGLPTNKGYDFLMVAFDGHFLPISEN